MTEFDPQTCVMAGELREMIDIPESIPDCGWVPRSSIKFSTGPAEVSGDSIAIGLSVSFTQPFKWLNIDFTIDFTGKEAGEEEPSVDPTGMILPDGRPVGTWFIPSFADGDDDDDDPLRNRRPSVPGDNHPTNHIFVACASRWGWSAGIGEGHQSGDEGSLEENMEAADRVLHAMLSDDG